VGVPVDTMVAVAVGSTVGVCAAGVGDSLGGRMAVRVGMASGGSGLIPTLPTGAAQPVKYAAIRNMHTSGELFLILYLNLQLHFPNGFQQRAALFEA